MTKRIAILGGTFNPPHLGHLYIAEQVFEMLNLDEIRFMPNAVPPHKKVTEGISDENRVELVRKAIEGNSHFKMELFEIEKGGASYTYDTMLELTKREPNTEFYFIIGADMVEFLPKWYKIDRLMELVTFIGVTRSGFQLNTDYPIKKLELPLFDVSSSGIRAQIKADKSVRYMVPDNVYYAIKECRFYES